MQSLCCFGIWFSARGLGLLERPRYALESLYIGLADYVGFSTMPHFMLQINNTGNVPVTFSDFELILPRRDIFRDGSFVAHPGARAFIDKLPSFRLDRDVGACGLSQEPPEENVREIVAGRKEPESQLMLLKQLRECPQLVATVVELIEVEIRSRLKFLPHEREGGCCRAVEIGVHHHDQRLVVRPAVTRQGVLEPAGEEFDARVVDLRRDSFRGEVAAGMPLKTPVMRKTEETVEAVQVRARVS